LFALVAAAIAGSSKSNEKDSPKDLDAAAGHHGGYGKDFVVC